MCFSDFMRIRKPRIEFKKNSAKEEFSNLGRFKQVLISWYFSMLCRKVFLHVFIPIWCLVRGVPNPRISAKNILKRLGKSLFNQTSTRFPPWITKDLLLVFLAWKLLGTKGNPLICFGQEKSLGLGRPLNLSNHVYMIEYRVLLKNCMLNIARNSWTLILDFRPW